MVFVPSIISTVCLNMFFWFFNICFAIFGLPLFTVHLRLFVFSSRTFAMVCLSVYCRIGAISVPQYVKYILFFLLLAWVFFILSSEWTWSTASSDYGARRIRGSHPERLSQSADSFASQWFGLYFICSEFSLHLPHERCYQFTFLRRANWPCVVKCASDLVNWHPSEHVRKLMNSL